MDTQSEKGFDEDYNIRSENWLVKNNDERVVVYEPLPNGEYFNNKKVILVIN